MPTKLERTIKREIDVDGKPYTVVISPAGIKVTEKGKRKGHDVSWKSIVSGDTTLVEDLKISVDATNPSSS